MLTAAIGDINYAKYAGSVVMVGDVNLDWLGIVLQMQGEGRTEKTIQTSLDQV
jgi:hypothetical protein